MHLWESAPSLCWFLCQYMDKFLKKISFKVEVLFSERQKPYLFSTQSRIKNVRMSFSWYCRNKFPFIYSLFQCSQTSIYRDTTHQIRVSRLFFKESRRHIGHSDSHSLTFPLRSFTIPLPHISPLIYYESGGRNLSQALYCRNLSECLS